MSIVQKEPQIKQEKRTDSDSEAEECTVVDLGESTHGKVATRKNRTSSSRYFV